MSVFSGKTLLITGGSGSFGTAAVDRFIGTQAQAVCQIFGKDPSGVQVIGARPGEKMYETLLTKEEAVRAVDMGQTGKALGIVLFSCLENSLRNGDVLF